MNDKLKSVFLLRCDETLDREIHADEKKAVAEFKDWGMYYLDDGDSRLDAINSFEDYENDYAYANDSVTRELGDNHLIYLTKERIIY